MIKGISFWSLDPATGSVEAALATAKREGFAALELAVAPEGLVGTGMSRTDCVTVRKAVDASGVIVQTLASGMSWGHNPVSNDAAVRKKSLALHKSALQRAGWLGCEAMLYVPGVVACPFVAERVRYDLALARATDQIKQLLDTADKAGVDLLLENVWNGFLYSPVEFAQFVDSFGHPRLGVYFDVGNVLGYHQHPPHWVEVLGRRIRRVHVKDFKLSFGWLGAFSFCGLLEGQVPWAQTMAALRAIGYDRTLIAEMMPHDAALLARTSVALDMILAM